MFDIGASELLVIVIVAVLVIGPKDLPLALRTAGRWIGRIRRMSAQFRSGFDAMIREAEMQDMEQKWRDQNAQIMAEHPDGEMTSLERYAEPLPSAEGHSSAAEAAATAEPKVETPTAKDHSGAAGAE